ncbi:MAG: metallophosphoesterase family protein, partial [Bacteroidia bacterium]
MKIAVLADIHANFAALTAVLADFKNVDKVICCGDMVGYYPDVNEVCDAIRNLTDDVIRGNHDAYIIGAIKADEKKSQIVRVEWTKQLLADQNFSWLKSLPQQLNFVIDDLEILVRHANPWDEEIYLYPDSKYL